MKTVMKPFRLDGIARPDLDNRRVPLRIMAAYMDVCPVTIMRWVKKGTIPASAIIHCGRTTRYIPSRFVGDRHDN